MKCVLLVLIALTIKFDQGMTDSQSDISNPFNTVLIAGGDIANVRDFPYMALLVKKDQKNEWFHFCGGSILTPRLILTAAHCLVGMNRTDIKVVIGVTELKSVEKLKKYDVRRSYIHPSHNCPLSRSHDVAVILLREPLEMRQKEYTAKIVTLPNRSYIGENAILSGYGDVFANRSHAVETEVLRSVELPVVSRKQCKKSYKKRLDDTMLCAGFVNKNKGFFDGDSGGPLVIREGSDKFIQIGIGSFRSKERLDYGVFADVLHPRLFGFINYIRENFPKTE
ncbi:trypsin-like [Brevipalpus obovatus]|uniref:trypsin-like n=1 Tax=Brevipalpus obovatus TaxID=246614 RepID=UPI003D9E2E71